MGLPGCMFVCLLILLCVFLFNSIKSKFLSISVLGIFVF